MRLPHLFGVAVLGGVLGAGGALAVAGAFGQFDEAETSTVVVERQITTQVDSDAGNTARPLLGNGFDPAAVYAARAAGVVTIYADVPGSGRSQGSGFVVDEDGTILTSAHVITAARAGSARGASSVVVEFSDGERVAAEIVGWDLFADTGVLRVDAGAHRLEPVPLGDSSSVSVGDPVAAIGSPFGNQGSLAVGVVSAIGRSVPTITSGYSLTDAIQIDVPINRGNSGGPLFDARGRVVGINAQIRSDSGAAEGVGFAVPVNAVRRSLEQILATGEVAYAYVGIRTSDVTPGIARRFDLGAPRGALVASVTPGSPAARAGLRGGTRPATYNGLSISLGGDLVVAIGDEAVGGAADIARILMERYRPGSRVSFTIFRDGERRILPVVLGKRSTQPQD